MKKTVSIVLMALLMAGSMSLMAQNKGTTVSSSARTKSEPAPAHKPEMRTFDGTIVYSMRGAKRPQHAAAPRGPQEAASKLRSPNDPAPKGRPQGLRVGKPDKEGEQAFYIYTPDGVWASADQYGLYQRGGEPMRWTVLREDGELMLAGVLKEFDPNKSREEYGKMYQRQKEQRVIAGEMATQYICKLPGMEGVIWVAEELEVAHDALPFVGMPHPVLEFDLSIYAEDEPVAKMHLRAVEVRYDKIDKNQLERFEHAEEVPREVLMDYLRQSRDR